MNARGSALTFSTRKRGFAAGAVTLLSALILSLFPAVAANAAPVYEINARWADDTPTTVRSGDVVNAEWRVNVNDDAEAPSNEPVDNVNFTLTIENGTFVELPSSCLVDGVTPASSISEDGKTLVCNIGTQDQGTAHVVQTPILADGETGAQLTGTGAIEGGTADLTPIDIVNDFGMDIRWDVATSTVDLQGYPGNPTIDLDLQWTLSKDKRSEAGPQTVVYDLTIASDAASSISVGGQQCTPFTTGIANGHPWSGGSHPAESMVSPVDTCTIQQLDADTFRLTLSGIDYEPATPPAQDSTGAALPVDQVALASGSIWLRIVPTTAGSVTLESSAPTYTSASGTATAADDPANNTVTKTWFFPGTFTSPWQRNYTGSGGTNYDDSYVVSPGTRIQQGLVSGLPMIDRPDDLPIGMCSPVDTRYLDFQDARPNANVPGAVIAYYVGNHASVNPGSPGYDPSSFLECGGTAGWTTTPPDDPSTVKAVRITMTQGQAEAANIPGQHIALTVGYRVKDDVAVGQDIWNFMFTQAGADRSWNNTGAGACAAPTPGLRYPCTVGALRDLVRIVAATPYIEKSADRAAVNPGQPVVFSLTYSANVPTNLPESVDDYQIADTLPVGMSYVEGSAEPAPAVTIDAEGRQVLTWTLDGVQTNANHALSYEAIADASIAPGTVLQNTAIASVSGTASRPATAQVTVSSNGYTSIGKTADTPYIPNVNGDGVGDGSWTVTLRSFDPLPQAFTDTIDILPYNGDDRGTSFSGGYTLTGVNTAAGATVYYTDADPASLSDDPADESNGVAGNVDGNTVGWSTTMPENPTAVRVIGPELAPGATQAFTVNITTDGVIGGDLLVNRAQARDEHTELVMRTSAPMTVANYYSSALKKYVQDKNGDWRDANDVTDYPKFYSGDTIKYRIVIENTGQGTLRNVKVSDDKQPELGEFIVEELIPGAKETHEYEIVADDSMPQTLVNTACATADQPEDTEVPPTINCDPAGFELVGKPDHDKTLISANPIGGGQWEVVYGIDVINEKPHATSYDLDDTLRFMDQAKIASAVVSVSPDGVTLAEPAWDGQGNDRIASAVPLLANNDAAYTPHHYEVTVIADVPIHLDGAGSGENDPTRCGPAGDKSNSAFNNTSVMTDPTGAVDEGQACAEPPSISVDKSVASGPTEGEDGRWTVVYDIVATNDGGVAGDYKVYDKLLFGEGIEIVSADVIAAPEGVTTESGWTGLGSDTEAAENLIAAGVTLAPESSHIYQVEVVVSADADALAPSVLTCPEPGSGERGGLANQTTLEHNGNVVGDDVCPTVPPADPPGDLASTGGEIAWPVLFAALTLLLAGGGALIVIRRRRSGASTAESSSID
ncbi:hypothetical protein GCM10027416_04740 [Okibacterium endophyticum]